MLSQKTTRQSEEQADVFEAAQSERSEDDSVSDQGESDAEEDVNVGEEIAVKGVVLEESRDGKFEEEGVLSRRRERKEPTFVPKNQRYYLHDDRNANVKGKKLLEEAQEKSEPTEPIVSQMRSDMSEGLREIKRLWQPKQELKRWEHDKFDTLQDEKVQVESMASWKKRMGGGARGGMRGGRRGRGGKGDGARYKPPTHTQYDEEMRNSHNQEVEYTRTGYNDRRGDGRRFAGPPYAKNSEKPSASSSAAELRSAAEIHSNDAKVSSSKPQMEGVERVDDNTCVPENQHSKAPTYYNEFRGRHRFSYNGGRRWDSQEYNGRYADYPQKAYAEN